MMNSNNQATQQLQPAAEIVAMIPRINIHAFCDNAQTASTMQQAVADRRMAKAHTTIQLGGVMAAVQVYQAQSTPNVLLVESHGSREVILSELNELAQVCQPDTKVIVIGHVNDVILYRELIRQGVSEYLVAPLHQMQVIETIANLYQDPKSGPLGKVIAFVGAKGGVGSSTVAHNFAWMMSKRFATETVITDLDLAFGTAGLNFNQDISNGILDALGQPDRIDATLLERLLTKLGDKLSLLSGPGGVDRDFNDRGPCHRDHPWRHARKRALHRRGRSQHVGAVDQVHAHPCRSGDHHRDAGAGQPAQHQEPHRPAQAGAAERCGAEA